ncbi:hypothetical protein [Actinoplanes sp. NPDC049265]
MPRPAESWAEWGVLCADLAAASPERPPGTVDRIEEALGDS